MTTRGRGRKFGEKQSYPLPLWSGLLEHRGRMGSAIWEYIWCLDRITQEKNGVGFVNGGAPVKAKQIARDFKVRKETVNEETVRRNLQTLKEAGYLHLRRTPYGQVIKVTNSLKFGIWTQHKRTDRNLDSPHERTNKNVESLPRDSTKMSNPESTKVSETKKTQQTTRSKENPLYKKEGFSEFWKEYPRGEDKEDAAKVWAKIDPEEHPRIMAGLRLWKRSRRWQKEGGEYVLYAFRFLKKKQWEVTPPGLQPTEAEQGQEREMVKL